MQSSPSKASHIADLRTWKDSYTGVWQYAANPELKKNVSWNNDSVLSHDEIPIPIGIVGVISKNRLRLDALGDFQYQEEQGQSWTNRKSCSDAKLTLVLNRPPVATGFASDWDVALRSFGDLQELAAVGKAPREHFIQKNTSNKSSSLRFSHKLWEKRRVQDFSDSELQEDDLSEAVNVTNDIVTDARAKVIATNGYFVPPSLKETFDATAEDHDIRICPIFIATTGDPVDPRHFRRELEDSLVEVTFFLHHYHITDRNGRKASNTFSAYVHQIKILHKNFLSGGSTASSPMRALSGPQKLGSFVPAKPYARMTTGGRPPNATLILARDLSGADTSSTLEGTEDSVDHSHSGEDDISARVNTEEEEAAVISLKKSAAKGKAKATSSKPVASRTSARKRPSEVGAAGPSKKVKLSGTVRNGSPSFAEDNMQAGPSGSAGDDLDRHSVDDLLVEEEVTAAGLVGTD